MRAFHAFCVNLFVPRLLAEIISGAVLFFKLTPRPGLSIPLLFPIWNTPPRTVYLFLNADFRNPYFQVPFGRSFPAHLASILALPTWWSWLTGLGYFPPWLSRLAQCLFFPYCFLSLLFTSSPSRFPKTLSNSFSAPSCTFTFFSLPSGEHEPPHVFVKVFKFLAPFFPLFSFFSLFVFNAFRECENGPLSFLLFDSETTFPLGFFAPLFPPADNFRCRPFYEVILIGFPPRFKSDLWVAFIFMFSFLVQTDSSSFFSPECIPQKHTNSSASAYAKEGTGILCPSFLATQFPFSPSAFFHLHPFLGIHHVVSVWWNNIPIRSISFLLHNASLPPNVFSPSIFRSNPPPPFFLFSLGVVSFPNPCFFPLRPPHP